MSAPTTSFSDSLFQRWQSLRLQHPTLPTESLRAQYPDLIEELLGELALQWQEQRDQGRNVSAAELCADCPELQEFLAERLAALEDMARRFSMECTDPQEPPTVPNRPALHNGKPRVEVPGFELLEELGHGGMGVVYKAWQKQPRRLVAVKMLLSGRHARPAELARFQGEAESLAEIQHPHIVPIFQVGEADGLPYFAMEYVAGGSLSAKIKEQLPTPRQAAELLEKLARAMHTAHQRGIIHRDLKPANVLLTEDGTGKITDFGLAKRLDRHDGLTPSLAVVGTLAYMAPEQAEGKTKAADTLTDVYGLGAILYETLTGQPPFLGDSDLELLRKVTTVEPLPPRHLNPAVDRDLETICLRCLAKNPGQRYGSAAALADDLRRYLQDEPIQARPVGTAERLLRWARRRPALAALTVVSVLAVVALVWIPVSAAHNAELNQQKDELEKANGELTTQRAKLESANGKLTTQKTILNKANEELTSQRITLKAEKDTATRFRYLAQMNLAHRLWNEGDVVQVHAVLQRQPEPLRGWEWQYLHKLAEDANRRTLLHHDRAVNMVAFSRDDRYIASAGADRRVQVFDLVEKKAKTLPEQTAAVTAVAFSPIPTEQRLAFATADGSLILWDFTTTAPETRLQGHDREVRSLVFFKEGGVLLSADVQGYVCRWNLLPGGPVRAWKERHTGSVFAFALSNDDKTLFLSGGLTYPNIGGNDANVSAKRPISTDREGRVAVWDVSKPTRVVLSTWIERPSFLPSIAVHRFADGQEQLAAASFDHTVRLWTTKGKPLHMLPGHTAEVIAVAFSPDGKYLVSGSWDRTLRLWDFQSGQTRFVWRGHTGPVQSVAFSPDGKRLVSGSADGTVKLWQVDSDCNATLLTDPTPFTPRALAWNSANEPVAVTEPGSGNRWHVQRWPVGQHLAADQSQVLDDARTATLSSDGRYVAYATGARQILVHTGASGPPGHVLPGHAGPVTALAFSTDRRWLASVGNALPALRPGTWQIDPLTKKKVLLGKGPGKGETATRTETAEPASMILALAVLGSPQLTAPLAAGTLHLGDTLQPTEIRVWNLTNGKLEGTLTGFTHAVRQVALNKDGTRLATADADGGIQVWDRRNHKRIFARQLHRGAVLTVTFSPDGEWLASGGDDGMIYLWRLADGQLLTLEGHVCRVHSLAFAPDGKRLASGSEDRTVKVWDTTSGLETLSLVGHRQDVLCVRFSQDGRQLASASRDGVVRVWSAAK